MPIERFKVTPVNLVMKSKANKLGAIAVAKKKDVTLVQSNHSAEVAPAF